METARKLPTGLRLVNRSRGTLIADRVEIATSFWGRAKGLIGRRHLPTGFALVIRPCSGVHSLGMAVPNDVAHVDSRGRVVRILHGLRPWRVGPIVWRGAWVAELPAGTAEAVPAGRRPRRTGRGGRPRPLTPTAGRVAAGRAQAAARRARKSVGIASRAFAPPIGRRCRRSPRRSPTRR